MYHPYSAGGIGYGYTVSEQNVSESPSANRSFAPMMSVDSLPLNSIVNRDESVSNSASSHPYLHPYASAYAAAYTEPEPIVASESTVAPTRSSTIGTVSVTNRSTFSGTTRRGTQRSVTYYDYGGRHKAKNHSITTDSNAATSIIQSSSDRTSRARAETVTTQYTFTNRSSSYYPVSPGGWEDTSSEVEERNWMASKHSWSQGVQRRIRLAFRSLRKFLYGNKRHSLSQVPPYVHRPTKGDGSGAI